MDKKGEVQMEQTELIERLCRMVRELTEMLADEAKRDAMLAELDRAMGEEDVT